MIRVSVRMAVFMGYFILSFHLNEMDLFTTPRARYYHTRNVNYTRHYDVYLTSPSPTTPHIMCIRVNNKISNRRITKHDLI